MKDVTGTMSWLGHVPGRQREGLYGHGDIDFRILHLAEMEAAVCRFRAVLKCRIWHCTVL